MDIHYDVETVLETLLEVLSHGEDALDAADILQRELLSCTEFNDKDKKAIREIVAALSGDVTCSSF